jgi:ribosomal protein L16 Arg81 hydroxylase
MSKPTEKDFTDFRFFSSVEGHLVPRFATFQAPTTQYIGATRTGKNIVWNPEQVVPISKAECQRYRRELNQAVAAKALTERNVKDYLAWLEEEGKVDEENGKALEKARAEDSESASVNAVDQANQNAGSEAAGSKSNKSVAPKPKSGDVTK